MYSDRIFVESLKKSFSQFQDVTAIGEPSHWNSLPPRTGLIDIYTYIYKVLALCFPLVAWDCQYNDVFFVGVLTLDV